MAEERLGRTCVFGRHNPILSDPDAMRCNLPGQQRGCRRDELTNCPYHRTAIEAILWMKGSKRGKKTSNTYYIDLSPDGDPLESPDCDFYHGLCAMGYNNMKVCVTIEEVDSREGCEKHE